jgi:hypothetical protein
MRIGVEPAQCTERLLLQARRLGAAGGAEVDAVCHELVLQHFAARLQLLVGAPLGGFISNVILKCNVFDLAAMPVFFPPPYKFWWWGDSMMNHWKYLQK